ncbi:MAG: DNA-binding protein [Desulfovibrio sp.]|nr:MAG: DNA-binding protein [Desulfovibrio sp.]
MCDLYSSIPPEEYDYLTKSVRINGAVTSIRLERRFWSILAELAEEENTSLGRIISILHQEAVLKHGKIKNFTSLLRVICTTFLTHRAEKYPDSDMARFPAAAQERV